MPRIPLLRNPSHALTPVKMDRERWIVLEPLAFCLLFLCRFSASHEGGSYVPRQISFGFSPLSHLKWTFMQYLCLYVHVKTRRRKGKNIFEPFIIKLTAVDGLK